VNETETHRTARGSKLQIRLLVNEYPERLAVMLRREVSGWEPAAFDWRSPLSAEGYREYWDRDFLAALGLERYESALVGGFWPRHGPEWDALARVSLPNSDAVLLIEAKSHRSEMVNCCRAGKESEAVIDAAFERTRQWVRPPRCRDWKQPFYQFANRLAHLYFLRRECGIDARLVHIYFTGDPYYPTTRDQWEDWMREVRFELGIDNTRIEGLINLFVPAPEVNP
jgi:hypothetical protein